MIKIKFCGLTRPCDIEAANALKPDYIGFVFVPQSKRAVSYRHAVDLKNMLDPGIKAVGVFLDENIDTVASMMNLGIIDLAQLHGSEDNDYINRLKEITGKPVIKAFKIKTEQDVLLSQKSTADFIILDGGAGEGKTFDWSLAGRVVHPFFLAGGLNAQNVGKAIHTLHPFALDVSSGIETNGLKDKDKMAAFIAAVRKEEQQ